MNFKKISGRITSLLLALAMMTPVASSVVLGDEGQVDTSVEESTILGGGGGYPERRESSSREC